MIQDHQAQIYLKKTLLFNNVISHAKQGTTFLSMDLKDMILHTPMKNPKFMKTTIKYFPKDIKENYELSDFIYNGHIYINFKKYMYCLKQALVLAYEYQYTLLNAVDCQPILASLGMWTHKQEFFLLVVYG